MKTFTERKRFVEQNFGKGKLARDGVNIAVTCPDCNDRSKKKFSINLNNWQCHCWVCGLRSKSLFSILKKFKPGCEIQGFDPTHIEKKEDKDAEPENIELPEGFIMLGDAIQSRDPDIKSCIKYLFSRGLREKDFWRLMIGTSTRGKFRRRVIFPSFDSFGDLNFFVTRAIDDSVYLKYINAKSDKKKIIFNEINIEWDKELTILEGPFDLSKSDYNSTCLLGSSLTDDSLLFSRIIANQTPVLLALDSDMVGKSMNIAAKLSSYGCRVRILDLGERSDVGEMSSSEFLNRKAEAELWNDLKGLNHMIRSINSGSII